MVLPGAVLWRVYAAAQGCEYVAAVWGSTESRFLLALGSHTTVCTLKRRKFCLFSEVATVECRPRLVLLGSVRHAPAAASMSRMDLRMPPLHSYAHGEHIL